MDLASLISAAQNRKATTNEGRKQELHVQPVGNPQIPEHQPIPKHRSENTVSSNSRVDHDGITERDIADSNSDSKSHDELGELDISDIRLRSGGTHIHNVPGPLSVPASAAIASAAINMQSMSDSSEASDDDISSIMDELSNGLATRTKRKVRQTGGQEVDPHITIFNKAVTPTYRNQQAELAIGIRPKPRSDFIPIKMSVLYDFFYIKPQDWQPGWPSKILELYQSGVPIDQIGYYVMGIVNRSERWVKKSSSECTITSAGDDNRSEEEREADVENGVVKNYAVIQRSRLGPPRLIDIYAFIYHAYLAGNVRKEGDSYTAHPTMGGFSIQMERDPTESEVRPSDFMALFYLMVTRGSLNGTKEILRKKLQHLSKYQFDNVLCISLSRSLKRRKLDISRLNKMTESGVEGNVHERMTKEELLQTVKCLTNLIRHGWRVIESKEDRITGNTATYEYAVCPLTNSPLRDIIYSGSLGVMEHSNTYTADSMADIFHKLSVMNQEDIAVSNIARFVTDGISLEGADRLSKKPEVCVVIDPIRIITK